jgi:hypothetical protein
MSNQATATEQPLQETQEAVPMTEIPKLEASSPVRQAEPGSSAPTSPGRTDKGKEKEKEETTLHVERQQSPQQAQKLEDEDDSLAIEPTTTSATSQDVPVCNITLLLPTGARHPYKLDEKYLSKRNVDLPDVTESGKRDPFSISVYKLKELILREWREEWETPPASPSSIRLIHFGKLLDDKEQLKSRFLLLIPIFSGLIGVWGEKRILGMLITNHETHR